MVLFNRYIYYRSIYFALVVLFFACSSGNHESVISVQHSVISVNDSFQKDPKIEQLIEPYRNSLVDVMNEVIGLSEQEMSIGFPEGILGNFMCDLMLDFTRSNFDAEVDFALTNNGGLRNPIPKDSVRLGHVFELMPFDNIVTIVKLNGDQMQQLLEYIVVNKNVAVSGLRIKIKDDKVVELLVNNEEFDKEKIYKVVTSDYLANGGDNMKFFRSVDDKVLKDILLRDMIRKYIQEKYDNGFTINAELDGRIEIIE